MPTKTKSVLTKEERRAKRELRREKQRVANIKHAANMHELRVAYDEANKIAYKKPQLRGQKSFIGCSGWFYWHWRRVLYPQDLPTTAWFSHYARTFKTVELNAPFYSWPTLTTVKIWERQAADNNFAYTVKVCELITHIKRFKGTQELIRDFGLIADLLGPRMGCFLFQLPPSFKYTPARLKSIVRQLDPTRRNVVEFRHKSWWNEKAYQAFREHNIIFCSCSGPRLPDDLIKTADDIYVRFHGTKQWYRHDYRDEELEEWAKKIRQSKAKHVWAYFNNDREGYALKNSRQLLKRLETSG